MKPESGETVVQTRLDDEEYERLRRVANAEGLTLKAALRRAVNEYTGTHGKHDPDDPFFADAVGERDDGDADLSATETESYLYDG